MNIYITLNTFRDINASFETAYQMQIDSEGDDYIEFKEIVDSGEDDIEWEKNEVIPTTTEERYYEPIHSEFHKLTEKFEFFSKEDFDVFVSYYAFEIFSRAEVKMPVMQLNELYVNLVKLGHKATLISQESGISKSSTLVWLGTNKVQVNNFKFLDDYSKIWKDCDMLVTDIDWMKWPEKSDLIVSNFSDALKIAQELEQ